MYGYQRFRSLYHLCHLDCVSIRTPSMDDVNAQVMISEHQRRALTVGDQSAELTRLRKSEAALSEQLEAKEYMLQELIGQLVKE